MAEQNRSSDSTRETEQLFGEPAGLSGVVRQGGRPAREVVSRDELKRISARPAGAMRERGAQEKEPKS